MKQGAPIRDVNMDTGISVAMTDLAAVSIMSINRAPDAILAGTTDRLSFPNIMRTMWGMRSPIQPICPHMERKVSPSSLRNWTCRIPVKGR